MEIRACITRMQSWEGALYVPFFGKSRLVKRLCARLALLPLESSHLARVPTVSVGLTLVSCLCGSHQGLSAASRIRPRKSCMNTSGVHKQQKDRSSQERSRQVHSGQVTHRSSARRALSSSASASALSAIIDWRASFSAVISRLLADLTVSCEM